MRNNLRIKMLALVTAIAMLLCALPMVAMAENENPESVTAEAPQTTVMQKLVLNDMMDTSYSLKTKSGASVNNISLADRSQDYDLVINVNETAGIKLPAKGTFYYQLPGEVKNAKDGTYGNVTWTYDAGNNQFVLHFTPEVTDNQDSFIIVAEVRLGNVYDLYNIAKINGTYYRMAKTKIETAKTLGEYIGNSGDGVDNPVSASEYTASAYDFGDITLDGVVYKYYPEGSKPGLDETVNYYTATLMNVTAVRNKIGGMNGNNPRWLNGTEYYTDPNKTNSFHRNYEIKLYTQVAEADVKQQPLLNMMKVLGVSGNETYFRLKMGTIVAKDISTNPYKFGNKIDSKEYSIGEAYDFTNVVISLDGIDYVYSDHELTGNYRSYFTVKFDRVTLQNRTNGDESWYRNPMGFLDGSQIQYQGLPNQYIAYHRDYIGTLHKGNMPEYGVTITSSLAGKTVVPEGTVCTLTGNPIGFEETPYSIRWEKVDPATGETTVIEGETSLTYTFQITEETSKYNYFIVLTPIK